MGTTTKAELHDLVERLDENRLDAAQRLLTALVDDPVGLSLALAPADDEALTDEDIAAIEEGKAELAQGRGIPAADVYREFGM